MAYRPNYLPDHEDLGCQLGRSFLDIWCLGWAGLAASLGISKFVFHLAKCILPPQATAFTSCHSLTFGTVMRHIVQTGQGRATRGPIH